MSNAGFGFSLSMGRNGAIVGWEIIFMVWGASADGALLLLISSLVFFSGGAARGSFSTLL